MASRKNSVSRLYRFAEAKGYESVQLRTFLEKRSTIATS
jgi:hypothetical protein